MTMKEKQIQSFDGTRIAYQVWGEAGPWLVVANGYGGSFWAWREVFAELCERYRILIWDYRGFYNSDPPADPERISIADNCRDLELLMAAEGIERMVMAGWSVGVQVALEQYRRAPHTVQALALINGSHGRVLHRSIDGGLAVGLVRLWSAPASRVPAALSGAATAPLRLLARSPAVLPLLDTLGLVHGRPEAIREALQAVLAQDQGIYLRMVREADAHDTEDLLPRIQVPTLVTSGERDIVTRPAVGRRVAERIPGAVYFELPRATHYAPMEVPRLLANRLDTFIREALD